MSRVLVTCSWCHIVHERFVSQAKAKHLFCNRTCKHAYELRRNRLKRHKKCRFCDVEYCDITKRNVGHTCSGECDVKLMVATRTANGTWIQSEEQKRAKSDAMIEAYASGRRVTTDKERAVYSETMKRTWREGRIDTSKHWTKTPEGKAHLSKLGKGRKLGPQPNMSLGAQRRVRTKRETLYTSAIGGTRADLGAYFRSNWEANFARVLNYQGKRWEYEPKTFQLEPSFSYTPDFYVIDENVFYEIKGRMDDRARRQLSLMSQVHPDIVLRVIESAQYDLLRVQYKHLVAWEGK